MLSESIVFKWIVIDKLRVVWFVGAAIVSLVYVMEDIYRVGNNYCLQTCKI